MFFLFKLGPNYNTPNPSFSSSFSIDLNLLSRIPGRPYKEPVEIKVERDDSLDRDNKDCSKQSSEKSSNKAKRKHKVWDMMEQKPLSVDSGPVRDSNFEVVIIVF